MLKRMTATAERRINLPEGAITVSKLLRLLLVLIGLFISTALWRLSENGRYTLQDTQEGLMVIDTRTGEVSRPKLPWP
jgi:hypothetical protein